MCSLIVNQSKNKYVFYFHLNSLYYSHYLCATVQTYTITIITITACPTIIRYSAHNLVVSINFYSLELNAVSITSLMIAMFSPFIVQHIQSNELSRNGRFAFSAFREVFYDRLYILTCCQACLSLMLIV